MDALQHIHNNGVLHLDIKPQNILVDGSLNIKIADFGSSFLYKGENDFISCAKGTSFFLPPEALKCNGNYYSGRKSDIWCVGITLFCMVFNKLPYNPKNNGFAEIKKAIQEMVIDFNSMTECLSTCPSSEDNKKSAKSPTYSRYISEGLRNLLEKMLNIDPDQRFTIEELLEDEWLNDL